MYALHSPTEVANSISSLLVNIYSLFWAVDGTQMVNLITTHCDDTSDRRTYNLLEDNVVMCTKLIIELILTQETGRQTFRISIGATGLGHHVIAGINQRMSFTQVFWRFEIL